MSLFTLLILSILAAAVVLWRYLPVGKLHGRTIRLHEWHRWRHNLRWEKIDRKLAAAKTLPPANRLVPLTKLAHKHFSEPLGKGDSIIEEIGALGTDESLALITDLLRDAPDRSAKPLLRGLLTACRNAIVSAQWRNSLFDALAVHLDEPEWPGRNGYFEHYYEVLLALDGSRAMNLFCTPARMALNQPDLQGLLRAINFTGNVIPRPLARALMTSRVENAPPDWNLPPEVAILEAWAAHEPAESKAGLWQIIRTGKGNAVKAAETLLGFEGLPHPRYAIDDRVGHLGLDFVSEAEKVVWLVDSCYIYPLSCKPLPVYFEENYTDHFDSVVSALIEVGAASHAAWLADAGKLFGESGPSINPEVRAGQMAAMRPSAHEVLESFAENSDHLLENIELLILIYILEHPDQFPRSLDP